MNRLSPIDKKFWHFIAKTDNCWKWLGPMSGCYGSINGIKAHRYSFEYHYGPIPKGLQVCHTCDVPPCVNPEHLFIGDQKDNLRDCSRKGRHAKTTSLKGAVFSEQEKQSKNYFGRGKGRIFSAEHRRKIGLSSKGRPKSPETIEKIRTTSTGRRLTPEQKEKRRLAIARSWIKRRERGDHLRVFGRG